MGLNVVDLAQISSKHLKAMSRDPRFEMFILQHAARGSEYVYVVNDDGCKLEPHDLKSLEKTNVRDELGKKFESKVNGLTQISGASVFALRCLKDHDFITFAKIVSFAPEIIMPEICDLPLSGNIFTHKAAIAVLRQLTPTKDEGGNFIGNSPEANKAISRCITHFFQYSSVKDLKSSLQKPLQYVRDGEKNKDLLVQNDFLFLHEVVNLRKEILAMKISDLSDAEQKACITEAGWQTAELMGNTFAYITNFARSLVADQEKVVGIVSKTISALEAIIGVALSNVPAPSGIGDATNLTADTIGQLLSKWAIKTDSKLDINLLATRLAEVSDDLKLRAILGLLIPGSPEVPKSMKARLQADAIGWQQRENHGAVFAEAYKNHLETFKEHYLEKTAKSEAKNITS